MDELPPLYADSVYSDPYLQKVYGIDSEALAEARKSGQLRFIYTGSIYLYFGRWLDAWFELAAATKESNDA